MSVKKAACCDALPLEHGGVRAVQEKRWTKGARAIAAKGPPMSRTGKNAVD